jgi:hypothetical protein
MFNGANAYNRTNYSIYDSKDGFYDKWDYDKSIDDETVDDLPSDAKDDNISTDPTDITYSYHGEKERMVDRDISQETVEGIMQRVPFTIVWKKNKQRRQYILIDERSGKDPPDFIKIITTHDPDNLNVVHVITAIRNDPTTKPDVWNTMKEGDKSDMEQEEAPPLIDDDGFETVVSRKKKKGGRRKKRKTVKKRKSRKTVKKTKKKQTKKSVKNKKRATRKRT